MYLSDMTEGTFRINEVKKLGKQAMKARKPGKAPKKSSGGVQKAIELLKNALSALKGK